MGTGALRPRWNDAVACLEELLGSMRTFVCSNPAKWHPTLHRIESHHNPPRSWTTDDGRTSQLLDLCGLCHNEIHALLNEWVRHDGKPAPSVVRTFSPFIRNLAEQAWSQRIPGKTPYTNAHGESP